MKGITNFEKISSVAITIAMLLVVTLLKPATALNLSLMTDKPSYLIGEIVELTVDVNIENGESIPFTDALIKVSGIDPHNSGLTSTCLLSNLNQGPHPECSSQDSNFQSVTITYFNAANEFGNRSAEFEGEEYAWGYGYGYKNNPTAAKIVATVEWRFPVSWDEGNYKAEVEIRSEKDLLNNYPTFTGSTQFSTEQIESKVAFFCKDSTCSDGIESDLIAWLRSNGWTVEAKAYDEWTNTQLDDYALMMCSDEVLACKPKENTPMNFQNTHNSKPLVEVADDRYAFGAFYLGYIDSANTILDKENLNIVQSHPLTNGYFGETKIFPEKQKMSDIPENRLPDEIISLGEAGNTGRSTMFIAEENGTTGRYLYLGWFYKGMPSNLTEIGNTLLKRSIKWAQCSNPETCNVIGDTTPPAPFNGKPTGIIKYRTTELSLETNENSECRGSVDLDKDYENMTFEFTGSELLHKYIINEPLSLGEHTVYVRCVDRFGNKMASSYHWAFTVQSSDVDGIAFFCKDSTCSDGIESDLIAWLRSNGWTVEAKAYDEWTNTQLDDYALMMCSDEVLACKPKENTPMNFQNTHNSKPLVEVADDRYAFGAFYLGYIDSANTILDKENLNIVQSHPLTNGYFGETKIFPEKQKMSDIPENRLPDEIISLGEAGATGRSTMFIAEANGTAGRYLYLGWFYKGMPSGLTKDGQNLFARSLYWAQCGDIEGCS